ncbi:hypothetical protein ACIN5087_3444 [Acinetobacter baumannii OIFC087]|nr:hypothetical protein ACIN5087_3444 [Acinetobacter baumannii OIFC087]
MTPMINPIRAGYSHILAPLDVEFEFWLIRISPVKTDSGSMFSS